jgi:hypothetical protein
MATVSIVVGVICLWWVISDTHKNYLAEKRWQHKEQQKAKRRAYYQRKARGY